MFNKNIGLHKVRQKNAYSGRQYVLTRCTSLGILICVSTKAMQNGDCAMCGLGNFTRP